MPTGKVKWYDAEKGFGFLSRDEGPDVYVRNDALPAGVTTLKAGTRVEFGIVQGKRGDQALQVRLLEPAQSVSKAMRKKPADMVNIIEDLYRLLENVEKGYRNASTAARGARVAAISTAYGSSSLRISKTSRTSARSREETR